MKKFFALLLSLGLVFSLAACGSDNSGSSSSSGAGSSASGSLPVSGSVSDVEDGEPDSSDAPENLPAGEDAGDAAAPPASDPAGDAEPATPPASKPSGGSSASKPTGGNTTKPENTTKPSGGTSSGSASKPDGSASSGSSSSGSASSGASSSGSASSSEESLSDLMGTILDGVQTPNYSISELAGDSFPYMLFIDQPEGASAVSADALIGSIAHSVVLMRLSEGSDVEGIAKQVEDNADPRKWICVEAEKTIVKTNGNLVLLVMSDTATADAIAANFDAL